MFLDIIVVALAALAVFKGLRNGLVVAIFSFLAFIIGLAAALKLSAVAARYIGSNVSISGRWLPFIAFAVVFFMVVLLIRLGARVIERFMQLVMLGWLNRIGGIILYALIYLFIFSIVLFYVQQMQLIKPETVQASVTYPYFQPLGPKIINATAYIFPFFKNMFAELEQFFSHLSVKLF